MPKRKKKKPALPSRKKKRFKKTIPGGFQREVLLPIIIVIAITFIVFIPSLNNDFVNWDDGENLLENPYMAGFTLENIKGIFTTNIIGGYNPLSTFTLAIENALFGTESAFIYHLDNLLLHLVGVFFVYRIGLAMGLNVLSSAFLALLFGIHPMRVESVAWVTERKDVLFGAFYLSGFYCYLKFLISKRKEKKWWYGALGLFFLSLFAKIQAVAFPLAMLAADYYFKRPLKFKLIFEKWAFFLLSLLVGLLGIYFLKGAGTISSDSTVLFSFFERILIGFYSLVIYLIKFIFPYEMSPLYPYPASLGWQFYLAPVVILGLVAALYKGYQNGKRPLIFGSAFFFFNVVFVLQVVGAGQGYLADRFTYIPYLGLFFIAAWYFQWIIKNRKSWVNYLYLGAAGYLLILAVMTWRQTKIWENGYTLWTHAITIHRSNTTVWQNRGQYLREAGQAQKAIADFNQAISLAPGKALSYNSLGKTYFELGDQNQALTNYNTAIQLDQSQGEFFSNRGAVYGSLGRFEEALSDLNRAIELDPNHMAAYRNRLQVLFELGQLEASLADHNVYLPSNPSDVEIIVSRAIILQSLGRYEEALPDINRGIQLDPDNGGFYYERAKIQYALGNTAAARQDALKAQQFGWQNIDPRYLQ